MPQAKIRTADIVDAQVTVAKIAATGTPSGSTILYGNGTWATPPGGSAHTVQDEGTSLTQRSILNFVGAGVAVTDDGTKTVVTIAGGGGGITASSTDTFTNKSIALSGNTITGTKAEFDTAVTDGNFLYVGDITQGVTQMAAIGSTPNANGASISTNTLTLQPASASFGGVVTTATQTFAGAKTYNDDLRAVGNFFVGTSTVDSTLRVYGNGTVTSAAAGIQIAGSTNVTFTMSSIRTTTQEVSGSASYGSYIIGANAVTEASSGTHNLMANLAIKPLTITGAGATTTNSATVYIEGAATGATNNYSLWVDAGNVKFDGDLTVGGNTITGNLSPANLMVGAIASVWTQLIVAGVETTTSQSYRTTNTGGDLFPKAYFGTTSVTAGARVISLEGNTSTNGIVLSSANGVRQIARASVQITNLVDTAGSESGDLIFLTQSGGTAMSEKMRITGTGELQLPAISSATKTDVLYYDSTTKAVSYGAAPTGGAGVTDGDKGDVIVSASGATWLIDKAIAYTWTAAHAFNAGLTAASTGTTFGLGTRTIDSQTVNGSNDAKFKLDSSGGLATSTWQVNEAVDGSFITMTANDLTISTGALKLPAVAFATKLDVLYYDAATKVVSYGTAPGAGASIGRNYATPTSNFTVFSTGNATDYIYFATNTITGTLSSAVSNADKIIVKNKGTGVVTLITVFSETIDGSSSITIQPGNSVTLLSDGANWFII